MSDTPGQEPETTPNTNPGDGDDAFDKERALATIRNLREVEKTAKQQKKELDALKQAEADRQAASLSDQEKATKAAQQAQAERDALATELRTERAKLAIGRAAVKLQLDPELAEQLALSRLEYDDQGQPVNVESLLKGLLTKWPQLATANDTGAALGNGQRQRQDNQPFDPKNPPKLGDASIWKR